MKNITKKLAACVCGLMVLCISSNAHAAGMAGTWKGLCDNRDIKLVLTQTDLQVAGTLELGRETFTVAGSTDNSSDNGTLTLEGTGGNGIFPRSCTADFTIPSPGQMTGAVTVRSSFGLKLFSGEASLLNPEVQVDFTLVIGHAQTPSNIYLFFTVEDGNGKPVTGLQNKDFEIYEDDIPISQLEGSQTIFPNPSVYTMATVLLLDMSGSLLNADPSIFASLKDSAAAFLDNVAGEQGQEVAIYYFDGQAQIHKLAEFSNDIASLKATIQSLTAEGIKAAAGWDPSTNLNGAVQQGLAALDAARTATGTDKLFIGTLVTFTDGTDQAHLVSDEAAVASVTAATHYSFTIGLGGEIDESHLKNLGRSGFAFAGDAEELNAAFNEIADTIQS
ncbi:MAG: VWA domain-containing protein, partial [Deltaproteobacteria bacterium]|nr:VWA domain-containing protein [Deltaproteobacteria bacterium]